MAPGVDPGAFEREWHERNLDVILARGLFTVDPLLGARCPALEFPGLDG